MLGLSNKEEKNPLTVSWFMLLGGGNSSSSGGSSTTVATVGSEGATLTASDGSWKLTIPAGALSEPTTITVTGGASAAGLTIPAYGQEVTGIFRMEPAGLTFAQPAILEANYAQKDMPEAGPEELSLALHYLKPDGTSDVLTTAVNPSTNRLTAEIDHFSSFVGVSVQMTLVIYGIITAPGAVQAAANNLISFLNGQADPEAFFQQHQSFLTQFINAVANILGTDPISAAFPDLDFDGDGVPNSADPIASNVGPSVTVVSSTHAVTTNAGGVSTASILWNSSQSGTYSVRQGGTSCSTGTQVAAGSMTASVNVNSGTFAASTMAVGSNTFRVCATAGSFTRASAITIIRDDTLPTVSVTPGAGNYGSSQALNMTCADTGGAGCATTIAYTANGTDPNFDSTCAVTVGTAFSAYSVPDQATTTVKVRSCDRAGNKSAILTQAYTVDSVAPTITVNSAPASAVNADATVQVGWQADKSGAYTIKRGGTNCGDAVSIGSGTNVSGNFTSGNLNSSFPATELVSGSNTLRICLTSSTGIAGSNSTSTLYDTTAPTVTVTPGGNFDGSFDVTASCTDGGGAGCVQIIYTSNGSNPSFNANGTIANGTAYSAPLSFTVGGSYTIRFLSRDAALNFSAITEETYILTVPVSFANDIMPIFTAHCTACHGVSGGLSLASYDALMAGAVGNPVVLAGNADGSKIICRLIGGTCGMQMPVGQLPLQVNKIDLIRAWINAGAQDN